MDGVFVAVSGYHVFVRLDADLRSWVGGGGDKRVVSDATLSWT